MGRLIVVAGPTASGKTEMALRLAQALDGEVISADSMQIYRRMDVGTAKPTPEEQARARHHMIDVADPGEEYSVARYAEQADQCVEDVLARSKVPIVCGGSGLYIEALIRGGEFSSGQGNSPLRRQLEEEWERNPARLLAELRQADPESAGRLHPNDRRRVLRALEVWRAEGRTISEHNRLSRQKPPKYQALWFGLRPQPREFLYQRINRRVTAMLERGLLEETQMLWRQGLLEGTAGQAIAYKEMLGYLKGECSLEEAAELLRRKSRNYAKRQLTWFGHVPGLRWLDYQNLQQYDAVLQESTRIAQGFAVR